MNSKFSFGYRWLIGGSLGMALFTVGVSRGTAQTIDPFYAGNYSFIDLGQALTVPPSYGGLTFKAGDPNTLLLGGGANVTSAGIYALGLTRDSGNHVTGFSGISATVVSANSPNGGIDGGLAYGPGNVIFYTSYSDNYIGQIKPGSLGPDKLIDLSPLGLSSSVGALAFVPNTFGGGGHLKILSFDGDKWYDATVTPDGSGTFNITAVGPALSLPASNGLEIQAGPEGVIFIPAGNPLFSANSVLIAEWGNGSVESGFITSYEVDANGDPILGTRKVFMSGLEGAQGAAIDPLTGDFLFSTFGTLNDHVIAVHGFTTVVPEPSSLVLLGLPLAAACAWRRKRHA